MINVGRDFDLDKKRWKSYAKDYLVAMIAAAMPWLLIALYYIFVLFPSTQWGNGELWKETLLLSRFAAPTSAGILFTMLAALKLKSSWMYKKIQVLAIFDDLDTILLMIPLQIAMNVDSVSGEDGAPIPYDNSSESGYSDHFAVKLTLE